MGSVVEIVTGRECRLCWSVAAKLQIVAEIREAGARVDDVAVRYELCESLVFTWGRQARDGVLLAPEAPVFMAVQMLQPPISNELTASPSEQRSMPVAARSPSGVIEIELGNGSYVCVGSDVNLAALRRVPAALTIEQSSSTWIQLAAGATDMRRGFNGLARQTQEVLQHYPFSGQLFVFRGRRGDLIKILAWHNMGLCLFAQAAGSWPVHTGRRPKRAWCR